MDPLEIHFGNKANDARLDGVGDYRKLKKMKDF